MLVRIKFWKHRKQSRGCLVLNYLLLSTQYKHCWLTSKSGFHNFNGSKLDPKANIRNHSIKPIFVVISNCTGNNSQILKSSNNSLKLTPNWTFSRPLEVRIKHLPCYQPFQLTTARLEPRVECAVALHIKLI